MRDKFEQVASETPFDNEGTPFSSDNVQDALEEVGVSASPGFGFGRSGNVSRNTWLQRAGGVPSNRTGVTVGINNPVLSRIDIGNEDVDTFDVSIYQHDGDGINLVLLTTVSVVSARTASFTSDDFGLVSATQGKQIAVRITSGSAKNIGVDLTLKGNQ